MADANESGDDENTTYNQAAAFESVYGAQVRMTQLEKAVTKNVLWGDAIIAEIKAKNASADTAGAEAVLAELKALKEEIAAAAPVAGDEVAKLFVDLKHDAIDLTREFRYEVNKILKAQDVTGMKKRLGARFFNETLELERKINQTRSRYNAEKLESFLTAVNVSDPALLERVRNGSASAKDIREAFKNAYNGLEPEKKADAYLAIKERTAKRNVFIRAVADKVVNRQLEQTIGRMEKRLEAAQKLNLPEAVKQRLKNGVHIMESRMEGIRNRTDARIETINAITQRQMNRIENRIENVGNETPEVKERLEAGVKSVEKGAAKTRAAPGQRQGGNEDE